jgi:hypothetical protein
MQSQSYFRMQLSSAVVEDFVMLAQLVARLLDATRPWIMPMVKSSPHHISLIRMVVWLLVLLSPNFPQQL